MTKALSHNGEVWQAETCVVALVFSGSKLNSNVGNGHESVRIAWQTLLKPCCKSDLWQFAIETWNGVAAKTPCERCSITIQNQQDTHAQLDGTIERRLPGIFCDFRIELMLIIRICTFGPIF